MCDLVYSFNLCYRKTWDIVREIIQDFSYKGIEKIRIYLFFCTWRKFILIYVLFVLKYLESLTKLVNIKAKLVNSVSGYVFAF